MTEQVAQSKKSYKKSLNLPKTTFPMKANLVQNERASLKRWAGQSLYDQLRRREHPSGRFVFHDGPPYANGSIHHGHLINKVLKDFVVRSKTMAGFDVPYVPGWDCHGLPIEHKVMQELGERARQMSALQIRKRCHDYARKYIDLQRGQFERLLTIADYENPYLTMTPNYESAVLEVFAELLTHGLVYRALKAVHWSIANQTALAEAELEYEERQDTSVYVLFELTDRSRLLGVGSSEEAVSLMIWTTTPWTLPANLAVAVRASYEYGVYRVTCGGRERLAVIAADLAPKVIAAAGGTADAAIATFKGEQLLGCELEYQHPFMDRTSPIVGADYVTLEDGTGLVHTAPGHGVEDYETGMREGLDIYCPVQADGTFDSSVPAWLHGKSVWEANELVVERLRESGHLFFDHPYTHSYPHDWRSKTPVIFRATEQWFVAVDKTINDPDAVVPKASLRELAMKYTADQVNFIPGWGRNRMRGMLESRPDWCLSRQRAWGLPIPAFYYENPDQYLLTAASVRAVAKTIHQHGSDYWFQATPAQLLQDYDLTTDPDAPEWLKRAGSDAIHSLVTCKDIFDVWFESGSSWNAVMRQRFGDDHFPIDLYLEGSDQHRGWFQLSLLPALGVTGQSPFKTVLTHGFAVDKDGRALSKSKGHTMEGLFKTFGADVLRWWVSSLSTDNDIKVDDEYFKLAGEEYRKVRNTLRFLLGNLGDFDPGANFVVADATSIDAWALGELKQLVDTVVDAYAGFQFRKANEALFNFCNDTMSAVYLTATKDRLYCDSADSPRRRRTQSAMFTIADALVRLLAPVLPHTADEAWHALHPGTESTVHVALLPVPTDVPVDSGWASIMTLRGQCLKAIEQTRQQEGIDNPLDCGIRLSGGPDEVERFDTTDLADLCGISRFELASAGSELEVLDLRDEPRCERSWKRDGTVKPRADSSVLSDRDADALGVS